MKKWERDIAKSLGHSEKDFPKKKQNKVTRLDKYRLKDLHNYCLSINGTVVEPDKAFEFFQEMMHTLVEIQAVTRYGTQREKKELSDRVDYILRKITRHIIKGEKVS